MIVLRLLLLMQHLLITGATFERGKPDRRFGRDSKGECVECPLHPQQQFNKKMKQRSRRRGDEVSQALPLLRVVRA